VPLLVDVVVSAGPSPKLTHVHALVSIFHCGCAVSFSNSENERLMADSCFVRRFPKIGANRAVLHPLYQNPSWRTSLKRTRHPGSAMDS